MFSFGDNISTRETFKARQIRLRVSTLGLVLSRTMFEISDFDIPDIFANSLNDRSACVLSISILCAMFLVIVEIFFSFISVLLEKNDYCPVSWTNGLKLIRKDGHDFEGVHYNGR